MAIDISKLDINVETAQILYVKENTETDIISTYLAEANYNDSNISVVFTVDEINKQQIKYYCDSPIIYVQNKFWYDIYTDELVPGKFFKAGKTIDNLINLQALSGTIIENDNTVNLNVELLPDTTENIGKIVWTIDTELLQYLTNIIYSKDTFDLQFSINNTLLDEISYKTSINGKITATALDITFKNELRSFTWDLELTGNKTLIAQIKDNTLYIEATKDLCEITENTLKINDKSVSIEGTCLKFT